jgi:hypothetical protein
MIEENRRLHPVWHDKLWQGSAAWPYCLVNVRENSPLRMRMASLSANSRIGTCRVGRHLLRSVVPLFRFGKLGAIEVEHEKPNGR